MQCLAQPRFRKETCLNGSHFIRIAPSINRCMRSVAVAFFAYDVRWLASLSSTHEIVVFSLWMAVIRKQGASKNLQDVFNREA